MNSFTKGTTKLLVSALILQSVPITMVQASTLPDSVSLTADIEIEAADLCALLEAYYKGLLSHNETATMRSLALAALHTAEEHPEQLSSSQKQQLVAWVGLIRQLDAEFPLFSAGRTMEESVRQKALEELSLWKLSTISGEEIELSLDSFADEKKKPDAPEEAEAVPSSKLLDELDHTTIDIEDPSAPASKTSQSSQASGSRPASLAASQEPSDSEPPVSSAASSSAASSPVPSASKSSVTRPEDFEALEPDSPSSTGPSPSSSSASSPVEPDSFEEMEDMEAFESESAPLNSESVNLAASPFLNLSGRGVPVLRADSSVVFESGMASDFSEETSAPSSSSAYSGSLFPTERRSSAMASSSQMSPSVEEKGSLFGSSLAESLMAVSSTLSSSSHKESSASHKSDSSSRPSASSEASSQKSETEESRPAQKPGSSSSSSSASSSAQTSSSMTVEPFLPSDMREIDDSELPDEILELIRPGEEKPEEKPEEPREDGFPIVDISNDFLDFVEVDAGASSPSSGSSSGSLISGFLSAVTPPAISTPSTSSPSLSSPFGELSALSSSRTIKVRQLNTTVNRKLKVKTLGVINLLPDFSDGKAWRQSSSPYNIPSLWGQCTWFAWARFYELYGFSPEFYGNGYECVSQLLRVHGDKFRLSSKPAAGAVFSSDPAHNHVGIVLDYDEEKDLLTIQEGNLDGISNTNWDDAIRDYRTIRLSSEDMRSLYGNVTYAVPRSSTRFTGYETGQADGKAPRIRSLRSLAFERLKEKLFIFDKGNRSDPQKSAPDQNEPEEMSGE